MKTSFIVMVAVGSIGLATACAKQTNQPAPAAAEPAAGEMSGAEGAPGSEAVPGSEAMPEAESSEALAAPQSLEVTLMPKSGSKLSGSATFTAVEGGVKVTLNVEGASPGDHGAHIHEKGDCSADDASSAGGHYNPHSHQHGLPVVEQRHLGDLGNISIGQDGKGTHEITIEGANLIPNDPNSFVGRAIIIHSKKDDGGQPTGNAGGRIGCGVIGS